MYRVWWVPWWLTWHLCLYICEKCEMSRLWRTHGHTDTRTDSGKVEQYSVGAESAIYWTQVSYTKNVILRVKNKILKTICPPIRKISTTKFPVFSYLCVKTEYRTKPLYSMEICFQTNWGKSLVILFPFLATTAPSSLLKVTYISRELFTIGLSSMWPRAGTDERQFYCLLFKHIAPMTMTIFGAG